MRFWQILTLAVFLLLSGCASVPDTWEGMGETTIAAWKALNVGPEDAQTYTQSGLGPEAVGGWQNAGFTDRQAILDWHGEGFSASDAQGWVAGGFAMDDAIDWRDAKFTPAEATAWKKGEFDLDDAIDNRDKGLTPIK